MMQKYIGPKRWLICSLMTAVAIMAISLSLCSYASAEAPASWKLDVLGFGKASSYQLVQDDKSQPYIPVEILAKAFAIGLQQTPEGYRLSWSGKSALIREGSLALGQASLPGPILNIAGKLSFPLNGITAFGIKLAIDENAGLATATIPRASIISMNKLATDGPTVFAIQLTFAPSKIESFVLALPDRLVIDLSETTIEPAQSKDIVSLEATRIRASMNKPGIARVVLELTKAATGYKVYQDPQDPSLIIVSFPGKIVGAGFVSAEGASGFEIKASSNLSAMNMWVNGDRVIVSIPDFLPDKALKLSSESYQISQEAFPLTRVEFGLSGMVAGNPSFRSGSVLIPLQNALTEISVTSAGAQTIKLGLAGSLASYSVDQSQDDRSISLLLGGTAAVMPVSISGLAEAGMSFKLEEEAKGARLTLSGLTAEARDIVLSDDRRSIIISFGGSVTGLEEFRDSGVTRLSFKYEGQTGDPSLNKVSDGEYSLIFTGVTGIDKLASSISGLEGKGSLVWNRTQEGLECRILLYEGLVAVLRPPKAAGLCIIDIGYEVFGYEIESTNGSTRVRILTSGPSTAEVFRLREPDRLVVDFPGFVEAKQRYEEFSQPGIVKKARSGQNTIGVARFVFDLERYLGHSWSLSDSKEGIDIVLADKLTGLEGRLILLDPGHGGMDGGAVGNSIIEKDINLDIALKLRGMLEEKGAVVVMTRSLDTKVDLLDRSSMANLLLPDAVVCIHSNSVISEAPNGTETYYYNAEELSRELAASVHKSLVDRIKLSSRGVFKKEYHMVKETLSPSILVEVGFLSNKQDALRLADPAFRQLAAEGIFDGLVSYFSASYSDIWAQMKDRILQSMESPSYSPSDAYWPGLMLQEPWIIVEPALDESIITQLEAIMEPELELIVP